MHRLCLNQRTRHELFSFCLRSSGAGSISVRHHYTDFEMPDFDKYRRKSTMDPTQSTLETEAQRKMFTYAMGYGLSAMYSIYAAKQVLREVVKTKWIYKHELAAGTLNFDVTTVPEGTTKTISWRGKLVFVRHRTQDEIDSEAAVKLSDLRDPQTDAERVKNPKFLVVVGICTHLGCIPIANRGDFNKGFYCPCHGSHYDASGRCRAGPAPLNLEVPPYDFLEDGNTIQIGGD